MKHHVRTWRIFSIVAGALMVSGLYFAASLRHTSPGLGAALSGVIALPLAFAAFSSRVWGRP